MEVETRDWRWRKRNQFPKIIFELLDKTPHESRFAPRFINYLSLPSLLCLEEIEKPQYSSSFLQLC